MFPNLPVFPSPISPDFARSSPGLFFGEPRYLFAGSARPLLLSTQALTFDNLLLGSPATSSRTPRPHATVRGGLPISCLVMSYHIGSLSHPQTIEIHNKMCNPLSHASARPTSTYLAQSLLFSKNSGRQNASRKFGYCYSDFEYYIRGIWIV